MWTHFLTFELRYWLRGWMMWIFLLVVALMIFGAVSSDQIIVGGALQNTHRNAPYVIENYYAIMCLLTLLMTTAFVNSAAARDFASNTDQIVFSTPVRKLDFVFGRYLGSAIISVIPIAGVSIGILAGKYMPWVDSERWGSVNWGAHLSGLLVFAIPNTIFIAAIIFAIAAMTRSTAASFLGALLLLTGYGVSQALMSDIKNETAGAMLDPFGIRAFALTTKYWTVAEKNNLALGYTGVLLWNRIAWTAVGGLILVFAYWRFSFTAKDSKPWFARLFRKSRVASPEPASAIAPYVKGERRFTGSAEWLQFLRITKTEFFSLVKTTSFAVIVVAALLNTIPNLIFNSSEVFGNTSLPVTYRMVEMIQGALYLFMIVIITFYAGVLAWKERDTRMDEIQDVLPYPEWLSYAAKFTAIILALYMVLLVVMSSAIIIQAFSGYHRYQFRLYVSELLLMDFTYFIFLAILAFFFHTVAPNKYIGYFAYVAFLIANAFAWRQLKVGTNMVQFSSRPNATYSDFYGYAPFLQGWLWFTAYWAAFCGLLAIACILLWRRGRETKWRHRMQEAGQRFRGPIPIVTGALALAWIASGAVVFYNTKVINYIVTEDQQRNLGAEYEKTYKKFEDIPQPRIIDVKYRIDLVPETRNATLEGNEEVQNKTAQPIHELHVTVSNQFDTAIEMPGASLDKDDKRLKYRIYKLSPPLAPGEIRTLHFVVKTHTRGFENEVSALQLVQNGTFINNIIAPQIGYQAGRELDDRNERKKRGLREKNRMPALEWNCTAHCSNNYISNNSDWVNVETVISTQPGQLAIAPGSLMGEWQENGRQYYRYKLDHSSLNFYSFLSAGYAVARDDWNGIKVEVYYLKDHPWNVPKMKRSIEKSFEYYTKNFGPYTHKEARIIEFPRVARFAQAFPGTMPYSESIGFIADLKKPDDIDHVFYVVAHEMAHQWWAHQVIGANMQGATILSETLAQYSSLMVMEKEYGRDTMRKFLKYEMDSYLRARGREALREQPLLRVEASQGYIHYNKGSVVMYYLREMIGEDAVNRALRKVLAQYGYKEPPYPTSYALVNALRDETPPELRYLIRDLFEEITLFSNRALSARAKKRPDGKYDVTVEVEAKKFKADDNGNEREVPVNDWIEVGAIAAPAKGKKYGKVLHREKVHMTTQRGTYSFVVDELPEKAGIDPLLLMVDRVPDDNLKNVDAI